jgi:hypothetical protein
MKIGMRFEVLAIIKLVIALTLLDYSTYAYGMLEVCLFDRKRIQEGEKEGKESIVLRVLG